MLSFGSAAYTSGKQLIGTFSANLETLPGATADPKTAEGEPALNIDQGFCRRTHRNKALRRRSVSNRLADSQ
jgi:hypothetical protein